MKYRISIDPFYYHLWVVEPDGLIDFNDENRYYFSTEEEAIRFKNLIEKKKTSGEVKPYIYLLQKTRKIFIKK